MNQEEFHVGTLIKQIDSELEKKGNNALRSDNLTISQIGVLVELNKVTEGYDTVLNEGAGLSAGQKQLITIARAMIVDAPLMILDEAASSVDTRTEQQVQKVMDRLTEGRTYFLRHCPSSFFH